MMIRLLLIVLLVSGVSIVQATGVHAQERTTEIAGINVNGTDIPEAKWGNLTFATGGNVRITFTCKTSAGTPANVRYDVEFSDGTNRSTNSQTEPVVSYSNLTQGTYTLKVQAFSVVDSWRAVPLTLRFAVSAQQQSTPDNKQPDTNTQKTSSSVDQSSVITWLIATSAFLSIAVIILIILRIRDHKKQPNVPIIQQPASSIVPTIIQKTGVDEEYVKKLELELAELREEVKLLRDQFVQLRERADQLGKQNLDLEEQVRRLMAVKKELEELQQQKDELFAIIIHDIKNPASLIKGLVDLLRNYDLNSQETQEVMSDIVETTAKIVSLSQEVSRVMAMENVQLHIETQKNNITDIIESVCRRNNSTAEVKNIKIFTDIPDNVPPAEFDPQKIEEVLDNLISNAIKFSMSGSFVNVRVIPNQQSFVVEIEDKGLGLSEDDVKKAFQRGMKLSARPTAGEPSSGLGLWIVKRLIEAHNGSVWVKSALGKGSTFGIVLPYDQPTKI